MFVFFQCVAEAVAEKGLRAVAEFVPGGGTMFDIAQSAWQKYRDRRQAAEMREDFQRMANATIKEVKEAIRDFESEIADIQQKDETRDAIYQLNIQFVPILDDEK